MRQTKEQVNDSYLATLPSGEMHDMVRMLLQTNQTEVSWMCMKTLTDDCICCQLARTHTQRERERQLEFLSQQGEFEKLHRI